MLVGMEVGVEVGVDVGVDVGAVTFHAGGPFHGRFSIQGRTFHAEG